MLAARQLLPFLCGKLQRSTSASTCRATQRRDKITVPIVNNQACFLCQRWKDSL
jgi:hypothetical protein